MANYSERRKVALNRLHDLVAAKRAWEDWQNQQVQQSYEQMKLEEMQAQKEAKQAEAADNKNWLNEGAEGAKIGGGVGGPWGALVGAIAGTAMGQKKAYDQRRKEGQSGWDSFTRTIFDTPGGSNKINRQNVADMAGAFGSAKASYDKDQARNSTARQGADQEYWQSMGYSGEHDVDRYENLEQMNQPDNFAKASGKSAEQYGTVDSGDYEGKSTRIYDYDAEMLRRKYNPNPIY